MSPDRAGRLNGHNKAQIGPHGPKCFYRPKYERKSGSSKLRNCLVVEEGAQQSFWNQRFNTQRLTGTVP